MHFLCKINKALYQCITEDIITDEVIITDERIHHIMTRHENDYNIVISHVRNALQQPDYILKDNRRHTGLIIKSIESGNISIVLRIHTSKDLIGYKNSVISCWKISEKRLQNYLRNKIVLYKNNKSC